MDQGAPLTHKDRPDAKECSISTTAPLSGWAASSLIENLVESVSVPTMPTETPVTLVSTQFLWLYLHLLCRGAFSHACTVATNRSGSWSRGTPRRDTTELGSLA